MDKKLMKEIKQKRELKQKEEIPEDAVDFSSKSEGKIQVEIEGTAPLLMNKYNVENQILQSQGRRITKSYDPKDEAEKSAYWSSTGKKTLIIPSEILYASILNASSFHKINKRSAKSMLAGSIRIEPAEISLGTDKYEIDTRGVVIQRNKVPKSRAKLLNWKASFFISYNKELIRDSHILREVLEESGTRIGIGDFRPSKGGPFGTFRVVHFGEI